MSVVAYVGDSRSMTIDNLMEIHRIVKETDENIWLHADACHGFSLGFSEKLKSRISGIELFDSISTDPHKVLAVPNQSGEMFLGYETNIQKKQLDLEDDCERTFDRLVKEGKLKKQFHRQFKISEDLGDK